MPKLNSPASPDSWYLMGPKGESLAIPNDQVHMLNGEGEQQQQEQPRLGASAQTDLNKFLGYKAQEKEAKQEFHQTLPPQGRDMFKAIDQELESLAWEKKSAGESSIARYMDEVTAGITEEVTLGHMSAPRHRRTVGEGLIYYTGRALGMGMTWGTGLRALSAVGVTGRAAGALVGGTQYVAGESEKSYGGFLASVVLGSFGGHLPEKPSKMGALFRRGLGLEEKAATEVASPGHSVYLDMIREQEEHALRGADAIHADAQAGHKLDFNEIFRIREHETPEIKNVRQMPEYEPRNPMEYFRRLKRENARVDALAKGPDADTALDRTLAASKATREVVDDLPKNPMEYLNRLRAEKIKAQVGLVDAVVEQQKPRSVGAAAAKGKQYRAVQGTFTSTKPGRALVTYTNSEGKNVGYGELFFADYDSAKVKVPSEKGTRGVKKSDFAGEPIYEIQHLEVAPGYSASVLLDLRDKGAQYLKPRSPSQASLARHIGGEALGEGRYVIPPPSSGRLIETIMDPNPDRWSKALDDLKVPRRSHTTLEEATSTKDDSITSLKNTRRQ